MKPPLSASTINKILTSSPLPTLMFMLFDYIGVVVAEHIAFALRNYLDTWNHAYYYYADVYIYGWVPLIFLIALSQSRSYRQMHPIIDMMKAIFQSVFAGWMTSIIFIYFLKASDQASRLFILIFGILVLIDISVIRYVVMKIMKLKHIFYEPIIIIGAGLTAERTIRFWESDLGYRYDIIGFIDYHPVSETLPKRYKILGSFYKAERIIKRYKTQTVIIAVPGISKQKLQDLINSIQPYVKNLSFIPDLIGTTMAGVDASILFSEKILMLNLRNNLSRRYNRIIKRIFDLVCTVFGSILISPVLLLITIRVAIANRGHVIFTHWRVGKNGKPFPCYKFQTMVPMSEEQLQEYLDAHPEAKREWQETFKLTNDPRVTELGAWLRRTSLDELPQIWNVIRGDMSLVGPRPIVEEEVVKYGKFIREYYMVLPGITGMWQVSGRSDTTYEERVAMDTWYVRNWSVWIDMMYLFKTVKAVITGKGAY